jgi:hypothetical protein
MKHAITLEPDYLHAYVKRGRHTVAIVYPGQNFKDPKEAMQIVERKAKLISLILDVGEVVTREQISKQIQKVDEAIKLLNGL